ncbi:MAG: hypothetical protein H5U03_07960 [Clostridia bacterium]|nr:hypothetical protein [Clostridia bacterium]
MLRELAEFLTEEVGLVEAGVLAASAVGCAPKPTSATCGDGLELGRTVNTI